MLSLAVSVGLTAAPSASAATWLEASDYLYYPPHNFGNVCRSRHIGLDAGSYDWQLYLVHRDDPDGPFRDGTTIRLRAGEYLWKICLDDWDTPYWPGGRQYLQCSWLDELPTLGSPARFCTPYAGLPYLDYEGWHDFGSRLQWLRR